MSILVVYFSRADENYFSGSLRTIEKGNTEVVAEKIICRSWYPYRKASASMIRSFSLIQTTGEPTRWQY